MEIEADLCPVCVRLPGGLDGARPDMEGAGFHWLWLAAVYWTRVEFSFSRNCQSPLTVLTVHLPYPNRRTHRVECRGVLTLLSRKCYALYALHCTSFMRLMRYRLPVPTKLPRISLTIRETINLESLSKFCLRLKTARCCKHTFIYRKTQQGAECHACTKLISPQQITACPESPTQHYI